MDKHAKSSEKSRRRAPYSAEVGMLPDSFTEKTFRWYAVPLRVMLGVMFIYASIPKIQAGSEWAVRLSAFVERMGQASYRFYAGFLESVVGSQPEIFAYLVMYGELLVGISLVLGAFTRLSALAGIFMVSNFLFAKGLPIFSPSNHDTLFITGLVVVLLTSAGRSFGVDYYLSRKHPKAPFF